MKSTSTVQFGKIYSATSRRKLAKKTTALRDKRKDFDVVEKDVPDQPKTWYILTGKDCKRYRQALSSGGPDAKLWASADVFKRRSKPL